MVFETWWKKHCASLKKKILWNEFLGSFAYEPKHDSKVTFIC